MKRRSYRVLIPAAASLLLIVGGILWALVQEPWLQRFRVGKATLTLAGVTYGTQHPLPEWRWWQHVPWIRERTPSPRPTLNTTAPTLVPWAHTRAATPSWHPPAYARPTDPHGCRFPRATSTHWYHLGTGPGPQDVVLSEPFTTYPRRDPFFRYSYFNERNDQPVGGFGIRNPTPGPYPQWTPKKYPIVHGAGRWEFALTEIVPLAPQPLCTVGARFRITDRGRPSTAWEPLTITVSDATGNTLLDRLMDYPRSQITRFQGLCLQENAWKLQVQFGPTSLSRPPDFVWETPATPSPMGQRISRTLNLRRGNAVLRAIIVLRPPNHGERGSVSVQVECPEGLLLVLAEARDERGSILLTGGNLRNRAVLHTGGSAEHNFTIPDLKSARSLRLRFQAYRLITASYLAEP